MLELKNFSNFILKEVSFVLNGGEDLLILGENGAGKSTLAKVLTGLLKSKNIFIDNFNINEIECKKRAELINYIPSKLEIFDEYLRVFEYLELCFIENIDKVKIENILKLLKIEHLKNSYCKDLSSGESQLLLLANALLHKAKITIFDELISNLDIKRVKDVFDILNSNLLESKIIITHNLEFAYALKYKILYLNGGKIEFFGTNKEFFSKKNIEKYFNDTIKVLDNYVVFDL